MKFSFDVSLGAIRVSAEFESPNGTQMVNLSLDTGSTDTAIRFSKLLAAGYSVENASASFPVVTAAGCVKMLELQLPRFASLGHSVLNFPVLAMHDVEEATYDGVLGNDFFRDRVLTIDYRNGTIELTEPN